MTENNLHTDADHDTTGDGDCDGGGDAEGSADTSGTNRGTQRTHATVRTTHARPEIVAAAVRPDNTPNIETRVVDGRVETTVERTTASGLRATVDDYVVNLTVADEVARRGTDPGDPGDHRNDSTKTDQTNDIDQTNDMDQANDVDQTTNGTTKS